MTQFIDLSRRTPQGGPAVEQEAPMSCPLQQSTLRFHRTMGRLTGLWQVNTAFEAHRTRVDQHHRWLVGACHPWPGHPLFFL